MRDANGRSHKPAGTPGAGRFEDEGDDSDLDMEPMPRLAVIPPDEPAPKPRRSWKDLLSTAAMTGGLLAVGGGALAGVAYGGTVLAGWISTLPHPGVIVGAIVVGLFGVAAAIDPWLHK